MVFDPMVTAEEVQRWEGAGPHGTLLSRSQTTRPSFSLPVHAYLLPSTGDLSGAVSQLASLPQDLESSPVLWPLSYESPPTVSG